MSANNRTRRRQFPGTEPLEESVDLPEEPLPPDTSGARVVTAPDAPLVLVAVGNIDDALLERVRAPLEETFQRPSRIVPALPPPKYAFNASRAQYHSAAILKRIEAARQSNWDAVIGIVDVDLFVPEVPFIFSEADRSTRSAIISLTRLRPEGSAVEVKRDALVKRLVTEAVHQVGLIRGLAHCPNNRCVMFFSATIQETDKKGHQFCANCRKRLAHEL